MFSKIFLLFLVSTLVLVTRATRTSIEITTCDDVGSAAISNGDFYIEIGEYDLFSADGTIRKLLDGPHQSKVTYFYDHDLDRFDENQHTLVAESSDGWCISGVRIIKDESTPRFSSMFHNVKFWLDEPCTESYYNGVPCFEEVTLYSDKY